MNEATLDTPGSGSAAEDGAATQRAQSARYAQNNGQIRPEDSWARFLEPGSNVEYLTAWLAIACTRIKDAQEAVIFVRSDAQQFGVGAVWHVAAASSETFQKIADQSAGTGEPVVQVSGKGALLGYPIHVGEAVQAVLVVLLAVHPGARLREVMRELHWASGWIEAQLWRGRSMLATRQIDAARLSLELLAAADSHRRFEASAMAVVNAIVGLTDFHRAALGMQRRRGIRLEALSRVASFKRRADFIGEFETAMDEAIAQDQPVAVPRPGSAPSMIDLAHRTLIRRTGDDIVLSVPLPVRGRSVGALTVTRKRGEGELLVLDPDAVEELRLAAAGIGPVLKLKYDERRWWSGRARDLAGRALTAVFGRRPAIMLGAIVCVLAVLMPFVLTGSFRISADAVLQGSQQRAAVALIDGYIFDSRIRAGDTVAQGEVLALLDDRDLRLEESRLKANVQKAGQAVRDALASANRAESAQANAQFEEAKAALDLVNQRLARLEIVAPISGMVVAGDLSQKLGAPVAQGDILFEIARMDSYRVLIDVSEYDLAHVERGKTGKLVLASLSDTEIPFTLTGIAQVSTPAGGENTFRVEADVTGPVEGLRPGMEGIAKIDIGRARLAWIWGRSTLARLQVFLWRFMP